jgi:hydroxyethylthiazole kinase-like uncharacterized protein yjeF
VNAGFILTAEEMRAAEARAIEGVTSVETLMQRAGLAAAEAIWRYAGPMPTLVLCGPGNNGGDGYVIARALAARGVPVQLAALGKPATQAALWARGLWQGDVATLGEARPAPLLVDALFGTGLRRPLDPDTAARLAALAIASRLRVAVDLPSGAATDDGALLSSVPDYELTVTFQTLKPSHLLHPAARYMGKVVVADIGIEAQSGLVRLGRPLLRAPAPDDHKYSRGYVAVVAGGMPGAAALAAVAAMRAGAGYVRLISDAPVTGTPNAIVQGGLRDLGDKRLGAIAIGPGLGRGDAAAERLRRVRRAGAPLVIDADGLFALADRPRDFGGAILTPHEGEFRRLFADLPGSKVERARAAARASGAVIVYKGADTIIAAPDGRAAIETPPSWLATAGSGDVLTGIAAARRAAGLEAFEAACEAVWLHARAAALAGPAMIADDIAARLPDSLAECL